MKEYRFYCPTNIETTHNGRGTLMQANLYLAYLEFGKPKGFYQLSEAKYKNPHCVDLKTALLGLVEVEDGKY